ncbi:uncharacterized protein PHALS_00663 [Plasmopara halstedii]|uniref:Uncharacterized protein n=1 Tax=Plasmopara halstedii TaxID=4781 RepID=A0A0P1B943_PLAHL|nr:uncharacterized protein PHALS_00663 [Plasmopara halstedii]CEG50525.1 hypothetical protein PHALS_00663 [Plasmopara halstedii]|eukprot:XP_024586894.1 hypothetical protein PHALS_00663 [Plasmopara halstedii]
MGKIWLLARTTLFRDFFNHAIGHSVESGVPKKYKLLDLALSKYKNLFGCHQRQDG